MHICLCMCVHIYTIYVHTYVYPYIYITHLILKTSLSEVVTVFITLLNMRKVRHKAQYPTDTKFRGGDLGGDQGTQFPEY